MSLILNPSNKAKKNGYYMMMDNRTPPKRSEIKIGSAVWVIEKKNYGTNNYTQGFVAEILTSASSHPRGIKVRLTDGTIGRVQWLMT